MPESQTPLFSLIHPTCRVVPNAVFPRAWRGAARVWKERCSDPSRVEYVISVHRSRWDVFMESWPYPELSGWGWVRPVCNEGEDTNVSQVNFSTAQAAGEVLVGVSDDLFPPFNWDLELLKSLPDVSAPVVVHCATNRVVDMKLINAGCITRAYYRDVMRGVVIHPSYHSMCGEWEYTEVAYARKAVIQRFDLVFSHLHWHNGMRGRDEWDDLHSGDKWEAQGQDNYRKRREAGFPA